MFKKTSNALVTLVNWLLIFLLQRLQTKTKIYNF